MYCGQTNNSFSIGVIDWNDFGERELAVVPVTLGKRRFSITCDCDKTSEDTSEVVHHLLDNLKEDDILNLSGRNLQEGVGPEGMKIRKVEELDSETRSNSFQGFDSLPEGGYTMLCIIQDIQRGIQEKKANITTRAFIKSEDKYLQNLQTSIREINNSMQGLTLQQRIEGAEVITEFRKKLTFSLFRKAIRPKIEELMCLHEECRSFDEIVTIMGYNRLFTRAKASAGTDVDFLLVIDTDKMKLLQDIRSFIRDVVAVELKNIGITIETEDYLMIDWVSYSQKLDDTRLSLFTLANMFNSLKENDNAVFITGSLNMLHHQVLHFDKHQLAHHYCNLLNSYEDTTLYDKQLLKKRLNENGEEFLRHVIDNLQKMACSEIYVGKNPYSNKKTIQTIMYSQGFAEQRTDKTIAFPIKFCLSRIADLINSTTIQPSIDCELTKEAIEAIEELGLVLSNIVCYQSSEDRVMVTVQDLYADITKKQIESMSFCDRILVTNLMNVLGSNINPCEPHFADACYEGLWLLADKLLISVKQIEVHIYHKAKQLIIG